MTTASLEGATAKAIGETIRDARLRLGMSKAEAARRAQVSRRTWHEVEEGVRSSSTAETLALFDEALGFPEGTLFAMTARSANAHVEQLRQRAVDLVRLMSSDELEVFVESNGRESLRNLVSRLERDVTELRGDVGRRRAKQAPPVRDRSAG